MRILTALAVTVGLAVVLVWLPVPGIWWHVVRWAAYLPILAMSARYGPTSGLCAGLAVSLVWALLTVSWGMGDLAWLSMLMPDFAAVGLFGGRLLGVSPRSRQRYAANEALAWPEPGGISAPYADVNLDPIISIQSAAGLLAEEDTSVALRQELADIISRECGRLSVSITGLLQRAPAVAQPQFREANLVAIVDAAAREVESVLWDRGIVVHKEIAPELTIIQCNPDQLRNLVRCLTVNAVDSAPAGDEVVLKARRGEDGVILEVRDQRRGSFISQVLSRFFDSRPEATSAGLTAAYDIVRQHGGKIEATVNVRKGREFSVWLPLRRDLGDGNGQGTGGGGR